MLNVKRENNKLTISLNEKRENTTTDEIIEALHMNDIYIVFDSSIYYIDTKESKVYYATNINSYNTDITTEIKHLYYLLYNSIELQLEELDEYEYIELAQEDYLKDELLITALKYNVNKNTVLDQVLNNLNCTMKELIIRLAVDNISIEDLLVKHNIKLKFFDRLQLKEDIYNIINISNL